MLEPAAANLINLKNKHRRSLLSTRLGSTAILTLILKASLETGQFGSMLLSHWSILYDTGVSLVDMIRIGFFLTIKPNYFSRQD